MTTLYLVQKLKSIRALSGFKADFGPLLGISRACIF